MDPSWSKVKRQAKGLRQRGSIEGREGQRSAE